MNNTFPIVDIDDNKLVSINGDISHFYELVPPDLEQIQNTDSFYQQLSNSLNYLDEQSYYKFYQLNKRNFVATNSESLLNLPLTDLKSSKDHLGLFFEADDLYSSIKFFDDYLLINGKYVKILSVITFSDMENFDSFLPIDIDYCLIVEKLSKDKSLKKLEHIRNKHQSSYLKNKRDISGEGAYSQAEELIQDVIFSNESLFSMQLFFIIRDYSLEGVNQKAIDLISYMNSFGAKLYIEGQSPLKAKSGFFEIFNDLIPGVKPKFNQRNLLNKTSHLKYLIPIRRSFLMDKGVKFSDSGDEEIYFNPFENGLKNRNMLVTGRSGGGKSVFVNKLVHHLIEDYPTLILDKGGSFKRLTKYHNGKILDSGFNPLQFTDPIYLREFILSVVDTSKFGKLEKGKLLRVIKEYLDSNEYYCLDGLLKVVESEVKDISFYFEGLKEYFTNEIISESNILYIDLDNYPKSIISPLIIFFLKYFEEIQSKEKILVLDECWSFLTNHSEFIDECFRTFRKSGAFPIAISQSLEDFKVLGSDLSTSITNNSHFKVFFPQELQISNEISEFDISRIDSLEFFKGSFSDCYLKSSDNKYQKVIRNYLSKKEMELFHTDSGEDQYLNKFINENSQYFKTYKETVDAFIRLKYGDSNL